MDNSQEQTFVATENTAQSSNCKCAVAKMLVIVTSFYTTHCFHVGSVPVFNHCRDWLGTVVFGVQVDGGRSL